MQHVLEMIQKHMSRPFQCLLWHLRMSLLTDPAVMPDTNSFLEEQEEDQDR